MSEPVIGKIEQLNSAPNQIPLAEIIAPSVHIPPAPQVDATTFTFLAYALYKCNIITRQGVRDLLELIRVGKHPDDVIKYLTDEVKKI